MAEQYNEVTNRLVSTRNADNPAVNHIVTGSDAVYDDNYPLLVNGYIECDTTPISDPTGNPHEQGWCEEEIVGGAGTGKYILTKDTTVELGKSYYKPIGARQDAINNQLRTTISDLSGVVLHANEYNEATIHEGDNPQENGWYELSGTTYVLTTDATVVSGKTYYIRVANITSNEDKIIGKEDGYIPTAGAVGRAMGANLEDNLQSTSTVKGLTANMGRVLNENKADINGYYETMSVGSAKNLDGETINSEAYLIRPTGGENNEVVSGLASVVGMEGNSCVWNQMVNGNNSGILNGPVVDYYGVVKNNLNVDVVTNHKYYFSLMIDRNLSVNSYLYLMCSGTTVATSNGLYVTVSPTAQNGVFSRICTATRTENANQIYYNNRNSSGFGGLATGDYIRLSNITVIDLTLLGIDNLTTVAEVEAWLAQHVGTKPHYAYNPGTILSSNTLGFKTYSRNLLNPEDGLAKLIPCTHTTNSNKYTVKGIPTGATVTYTPDNTGVAVDVTEAITDNTFDISSYGSGILYIPNATVNTYVCMKYDGAMDGEVVPYKDNTYNFDVRNVYGKNNGVEYQCYPNGMRGNGNVKDTLTASEAVVKIGSRAYQSGDESDSTVITDRTNTLYALSTPITYTDLIYRDGGIDKPLREVLVNLNVDNWSIEEQLMTDYDEQGNPTSIPATIQTKYSMDAVGDIKTLKEITYTETEVRTIFGNLLTCLNGKFSEELGGTFVIKDNEPPTPKIFDFEFVENASTNSTEENTETN